jgi:GTP pyrophosphokinase
MSDELTEFLQEYSHFSAEEARLIRSAWDYLREKKGNASRSCGEPFLSHPLRVARVLASLELDAESVVAAFLHGSLEELGTSTDEIERLFGATVSKLVEGTSRISGLSMKNKTLHEAESIRKMFFAMIDDIRIILVRLADRLDKMRTLKNFPEDRQRAVAQETIDIWAPLANRLGISSIKDELEDLSLKALNREVFDQIKSIVAAKKTERERFLEQAESEILGAAKEAGFSVRINSRAKHFWSIYQKMKKRNKAPDEIFDLLAMRVICPTLNECYALLGIVHTIWKPLDGRFKDYIAMPKPNGYQSLHTTVMSFQGQPLEIQIRTEEMHHVAENGIASHWLYKKGASNEVVNADHLSLINQLKELSRNRFTDEDFLAQIKTDLLGDSIYVFTPRATSLSFQLDRRRSTSPIKSTPRSARRSWAPRPTARSFSFRKPLRTRRSLRSSRTRKRTRRAISTSARGQRRRGKRYEHGCRSMTLAATLSGRNRPIRRSRSRRGPRPRVPS